MHEIIREEKKIDAWFPIFSLLWVSWKQWIKFFFSAKSLLDAKNEWLPWEWKWIQKPEFFSYLSRNLKVARGKCQKSRKIKLEIEGVNKFSKLFHQVFHSYLIDFLYILWQLPTPFCLTFPSILAKCQIIRFTVSYIENRICNVNFFK